jgi:hypothetical protein
MKARDQTMQMSWKARYQQVRLVLRQRGARDFQIEVGDDILTYFHPARDCDFNAARLRAYDHAVRFVRLRPPSAPAPSEHVATLEWERVEAEA